MPNSNYVKEFKELARKQLRTVYDQLTPEQAKMFDRMHGSIEDIAYDKMPWAYSQIRRTLEVKTTEKEG